MSNNLNITQLASNHATPEVVVNDAFQAFDAALTETLTLTVDDSNAVTLTNEQFRSNILLILTPDTTVPTSTITVTVPALERGLLVIVNDTAQSANVEISGQSETAPNIAAGQTDIIAVDGSNVRAATGATLGDLAAKNTVGTTDIDDDAVTYDKIQDVSATDKILGRSTAGAGVVEEIDCTAAGRALLDDADASAQRTTLGLGSLATQASNSVSITGGSISGITDLAIADGGTGASTASDARTNLGLGTLATLNTVAAANIASNAVTTAKIQNSAVTVAKLALENSRPLITSASVGDVGSSVTLNSNSDRNRLYVELVDDDYVELTFTGSVFTGLISMTCNTDTGGAAIVQFRTAPTRFVQLLGSTSSSAISAAGDVDLTTTPGTDNQINVATQLDKLIIENRRGGFTTIALHILGT